MPWMTDPKTGKSKRTVHCGWCYETGHNRAGCPHLDEAMKKRVEDLKKQIERGVFENSHWDESKARFEIDRVEKRYGRGKTRRKSTCSYCEDEGHNRRSCEIRKDDISSDVQKTLSARKEFAVRLDLSGFGPGALVIINKNYYGACDELPALVDSIIFAAITHENAFGGNNDFSRLAIARGFPTEDYPKGRTYPISLPLEVVDIHNLATKKKLHCYTQFDAYELVSPVNVSVPDEFLTLEGCSRGVHLSGKFEGRRPLEYSNPHYPPEEE